MLKACNAVFASDVLKAPQAIDQHGRTAAETKKANEPSEGLGPLTVFFADWAPASVACPFDEPTLEEWLVKPALECAKNGLDGLHIDWEPYATGFDSVGSLICYCDDCFSSFLQTKSPG
jgi:hypothetical protein